MEMLCFVINCEFSKIWLLVLVPFLKINFFRSTDDLIIIRMALEFGPETSIVTNDKYTDHRSAICNGDQKLEKIFDDFLTDASHRHFHGRIETRRNFNIRIRNPDNRIWILPVMNSEGKLSRNIKRYKVEVFRNS